VFVESCFWHCCPKHSTIPKGNRTFWKAKLTANQARDKRVNRTLMKLGWRVLRIWEHDLARGGGRSIGRIKKLLTEKMPKTRQMPKLTRVPGARDSNNLFTKNDL